MWKIERWIEDEKYWYLIFETSDIDHIVKIMKLYEDDKEVKVRIVNF